MNTFEDFLNQKIDNIDHQEKLSKIFDWIDGKYPDLSKEIKWN